VRGNCLQCTHVANGPKKIHPGLVWHLPHQDLFRSAPDLDDEAYTCINDA